MKISQKMRLDVESMIYFVRDEFKPSITEQDIEDTAVYSATGKKPEIETEGFKNLKWGKTYRDEAITGYRDMLAGGLITKAELIRDMPKNLKAWLWDKIKNFPYNCPTDLFMSDYRSMSESSRRKMGESIVLALVILKDEHERNPLKDGREILLGI